MLSTPCLGSFRSLVLALLVCTVCLPHRHKCVHQIQATHYVAVSKFFRMAGRSGSVASQSLSGRMGLKIINGCASFSYSSSLSDPYDTLLRNYKRILRVLLSKLL